MSAPRRCIKLRGDRIVAGDGALSCSRVLCWGEVQGQDRGAGEAWCVYTLLFPVSCQGTERVGYRAVTGGLSGSRTLSSGVGVGGLAVTPFKALPVLDHRPAHIINVRSFVICWCVEN